MGQVHTKQHLREKWKKAEVLGIGAEDKFRNEFKVKRKAMACGPGFAIISLLVQKSCGKLLWSVSATNGAFS